VRQARQASSAHVDLARGNRRGVTGRIDRELHSVATCAQTRNVDSHAPPRDAVRPLRHLLPLNAKRRRSIREAKPFRGASKPADTNLLDRQRKPNRLSRGL
jgi:hypothetical protein